MVKTRNRRQKGRTSSPAKAPVPARRSWLPWASVFLIVAATACAYVPAYGASWSWDDDLSVYANSLVTRDDGLARIWLTTEDHDFWPLTRTAFWLEYRIFEDRPAGYHVVNVVLHALASVLVYLVFRRIGIPGAVFGGLAFALHPVNAATVVWVSELKNILAMIFFLATVLCWLRFEERPRAATYFVALAAYGAALASKTSVVAWPAMMLGWAWWRRGRVTRRDLLSSAPFWALAVAMSAMTVFVQGRITGVLNRPLVGVEKLAGAGCAFWFYVYKAVLPLNLSAVYPHWGDRIAAAGWLAFVPASAVLGVAIVVWLRRTTSWGRALLFAGGYSLLAMAPVLGFFNSTITMHTLVADHYQYAPIAGVIGLICAAGAWVAGRAARGMRWAPLTIAAAVALALGTATTSRAYVLSSDDRMWSDTLAKNPQAWVAEYNVATNLILRAQRLTAALPQMTGEAEALLAKAQDLDRRDDPAGGGRFRDAATARQRDVDTRVREVEALCREAIQHFRRALELQPLHLRTYSNLGLALASVGREDEAIDILRRGISVADRHFRDGSDATLFLNLGQALVRQRRFAEALPICRRSALLLPDDVAAAATLVDALAGLAWQRSTARDPAARDTAEALRCVAELQQRVPSPSPALQDVYAAALADAGRFQEAVQMASRAVESARVLGDARLVASISSRLQLYSAGQPYRQPSGPGS